MVTIFASLNHLSLFSLLTVPANNIQLKYKTLLILTIYIYNPVNVKDNLLSKKLLYVMLSLSIPSVILFFFSFPLDDGARMFPHITFCFFTSPLKLIMTSWNSWIDRSEYLWVYGGPLRGTTFDKPASHTLTGVSGLNHLCSRGLQLSLMAPRSLVVQANSHTLGPPLNCGKTKWGVSVLPRWMWGCYPQTV